MDPQAEEGAPMPTGSRCLSAPFDGGEIPVYAYRPARADGRDVALLFPGMRRNASGLRDKAIALCEATGLVVYAPLLDAQRFPRWRYQHGAVARDAGLPGLSYYQRHHFLLTLGGQGIETVNDGPDVGRAGLAQLKNSLRPVAMHTEYRAGRGP